MNTSHPVTMGNMTSYPLVLTEVRMVKEKMSTLLAGKISVDELRSAIRRPVIQNSPRGYTLLELLVVLIIISLVSVMVAPKLVSSLGNLNFKTTAKRLSASLRYTRGQATSEEITYIALFN
jgi:prepilin-type N-terminal cleavage/methylation domain-containing protein